METGTTAVLKGVDCIEMHVPDLQQGIEYYKRLGLKLLWKAEHAVGLGMPGSEAEIVLQNEREFMSVDLKVDSVIDAVVEIEKAGGRIVHSPFDIPIGMCAVVEDPWGNRVVILDTTKGTYITDGEGNIIGQNAP